MKIWKLYVDIRTLSNRSMLLDQLISYECNETTSNLLFGISTRKSDINRFFELHRQEMFLVVEKSISKEEFDNMIKYDPHFHSDFLLESGGLTIFFRSHGGIKNIVYSTVLAKHEWMSVELGLEATTDALYDLYTYSNKLRYYYGHLFTKKMKKALDVLGLIPALDKVDLFYTPNHNGIEPEFTLNEWGILKQIYNEVLIGIERGDNFEDPFI